MDVKVKNQNGTEMITLSGTFELEDVLDKIPSEKIIKYINENGIILDKIPTEVEKIKDLLSEIDKDYIYEFLNERAPVLADYSTEDLLDHITDNGNDGDEILEYFKKKKIEISYSEHSDIINFDDCKKKVLCEILGINHIAGYDDACEALKKYFPK